MRLWRISAHAGFDGEGARRLGGRWNRPGTTVIYVAATLALAMLEFLAHVDRKRAPAMVFAHYADVPVDAGIDRLNEDRLPANWRAHPAPDTLRELGTSWVAAGTSVLLAVPSVILRVSPELVPSERNYLLNPAHAEFARIRVGSVKVQLDPRTWLGRAATPPSSAP